MKEEKPKEEQKKLRYKEMERGSGMKRKEKRGGREGNRKEEDRNEEINTP